MIYCFGLLFLFLSTDNIELDTLKPRWEIIRIKNQDPHQLRNCLYQTSVDSNHEIPSKSIFWGKLRHLLVGMNHSEAQTCVFHLGQVSGPVCLSFHCTEKEAYYTVIMIIQRNKLNKDNFFLSL